MKEDFLHYLWKHKKIPQKMTLTCGKNLYIESFGEQNWLSGADFFNARLQIGEQLWAGNVEMHLKSSYWYAHKHEQDPNYNNVILHVVWEHDVEVFNLNGQIIPTLELKNQIDTKLVEDYRKLLFSQNHFINCESSYSKIQKSVSANWHKDLFVQRLEQKADYVQSLLTQSHSNWEKTLFLMLLKNFGGVVNGEAFLAMGDKIDFSIIRKEKHNPLYLESLFLGLSGLLSVDCQDKYFKETLQRFRYLQRKYVLSEACVQVQFSKLRPQGFPTIRLSQIAQLYENTDGLFSKVIDLQNVIEGKKLFEVSTSTFWQTHYTFGKLSAKTTKRVSNSLIERIWINTIIPVKYLYFKHLGKNISDKLIDDLRCIPPEKNNIIGCFESIGADINSAFDTQVLLQQYKNYCQKNHCLDCAMGLFLLKGGKCK